MRLQSNTRNLSSGDLVEGAVAGLIGGLAATWVMSQFMSALSSASRKSKEQEAKHTQQPQEPVSPTVVVADKLSELIRGRPVSDQHKPLAGTLVHYGYGTIMGGVYGLLSKALPQVRTGAGLPWGAALWLGGDEIALPLLKLAPPPTRYALSTHASALAGHLVYGLATETTCTGVRLLLEHGPELPERLRQLKREKLQREEPPRLEYAEFVATGL